MLRITDTITGTITYTEPHDLHATLTGMFPDPTNDMRQAIDALDTQVSRRESAEPYEALLGVRVDRLSDADYLEYLADRSATARQALRDAVAASDLRESEIVAATGLARMTVRAWRPARTQADTPA